MNESNYIILYLVYANDQFEFVGQALYHPVSEGSPFVSILFVIGFSDRLNND